MTLSKNASRHGRSFCASMTWLRRSAVATTCCVVVGCRGRPHNVLLQRALNSKLGRASIVEMFPPSDRLMRIRKIALVASFWRRFSLARQYERLAIEERARHRLQRIVHGPNASRSNLALRNPDASKGDRRGRAFKGRRIVASEEDEARHPEAGLRDR